MSHKRFGMFVISFDIFLIYCDKQKGYSNILKKVVRPIGIRRQTDMLKNRVVKSMKNMKNNKKSLVFIKRMLVMILCMGVMFSYAGMQMPSYAANPAFTIKTEVVNGQIDQDCIVTENNDITIHYEGDVGYELKSIKVDDQLVDDITGYEESYTFKQVVAEHSIKVVYEKKTNVSTSNDFELLGSKELEGGTLFADQFTFSAELKSDGGSGATFNFSSPVTNASDGSVLFSVTSTDVPSTFTGNVLFEIVEVNDHQAGITYDSSPVEASVPFENGVVDTNGITYTRLGADGSREELEGADFTNRISADKYSITTNITGGTIDASITEITKGSDETINYSPSEGYELKSITVDGQPVDITEYPSSYIFSDIAANHTIAVICEKKDTSIQEDKYSITTGVTGGSIDPSVTASKGDNKTIYYNPSPGYKLKSITIDVKKVDITKSPTSYTFDNITANHNIDVVYEIEDTEGATDEGTKTGDRVIALGALAGLTLLAIAGIIAVLMLRRREEESK